MRRFAACLACGVLAACGSLADLVATPAPIPDDCWFLDGQAIGFSGTTTLGELGMGGPNGRWDHVQVHAWITEDRIDLWGGAELTQAVCAVTKDRDFIAQTEGAVVWNEYPVINGGPDPGLERDD